MTKLSDIAFDIAQGELFDIREMEDMEIDCSFERVIYDTLISYGEMALDMEEK